MKAKYRWLLLAPAAALILVLGPLQDRTTAAGEAGAETPAAIEVGGSRIEIPGPWEVGAALIGVLVLGCTLLYLAARLKDRGRPGGGQLITMRQSIRLSARHSLHAVQFEDRLLLLGASDAGVNVLGQAPPPEVAADVRAVDGRDDDHGVDLRDTIIPRPPHLQPGRGVDPATLASFRTLLKKTRSEVR